jgi:hypothetical protein
MKKILMALPLVLAACGPAVSGAAVGETQRDVAVYDPQIGIHNIRINPSGPAAVVVPFTPEAIWSVLPRVYAELGIQGTVIDERRRMYGQPQTSVRRRFAGSPISNFLDCGCRAGLQNADSYNVVVLVVTELQPAPENATHLRTYVEASARAQGGTDPTVRCGSKQVLEQRIQNMALLALALGT